MSGVSPGLARSLVSSLGRDCGTAAVVARVLQERPESLVSEDMIMHAGPGRAASGSIRRALADFERRGWCSRVGALWRPRGGAAPPGLADFLSGAAAMRAFGTPETAADPVVTLPEKPCRIAEALPETGLSYARLVGTESAFHRVARSARRRFVLMTPFLNDEGAEWATGLFQATEAPERLLIVRAFDRIAPVLLPHASALRRLGVTVMDYFLPDPDGGGYETFHAKIVMADDRTAYVGSANLLVYERRSMELGFLVSGAAVQPVAALVSAVTRISHRAAL